MSKIENSTILEVSEMLQNVLKQDSEEKPIDNEEDIPVIEIILPEKGNIEKKTNEENIFEKTDEKFYGDDFEMKNNYSNLYDKFMDCKCSDKDDDRNVSIYGCKWDDDWDCSWDDKYDCDDKCCKSLRNRKSFKCSSDVFEPVYCNAICNVPRMDIIKMVAEGQGTIADAGLEPEEPEEPGEAGQLFTAAALAKACKCGNKCKCGKKCKCGNGEETEDAEIAFKFFIGKKHNKYVGNMCLVNYDEGIFLTSDKLECFHSPDHTKFVAIFHFEEADSRSREVAVYGTTQICNILPTLFIFSAPHCGEDDVLAMGGSVTTGTITITKKEDTENEMMVH